jgi:hypothetical protein
MENNKSELVRYCKLLKQHDFYFDKTDDPRIWEQGKEKETQILKLRNEIDSYYDGLGKLLYDMVSPFEKIV